MNPPPVKRRGSTDPYIGESRFYNIPPVFSNPKPDALPPASGTLVITADELLSLLPALEVEMHIGTPWYGLQSLLKM